MTTPLLGLRTVIHPVADLVGAKQWFTDLLGFGPYFDEPFYVGFEVAGYELGLLPDAESVRWRARRTGASTTSRPRWPTRSRGGATVHTAAVGGGRRHRDRDGHVTAGLHRRLHRQPALRRELSSDCLRGATSSMVMPSGSRSWSEGLPSSRIDAGVVDPDVGEVIGPPSQGVAVGDREREVIERLGGRVAVPRIGVGAVSTTTTWLGRCCSAT